MPYVIGFLVKRGDIICTAKPTTGSRVEPLVKAMRLDHQKVNNFAYSKRYDS